MRHSERAEHERAKVRRLRALRHDLDSNAAHRDAARARLEAATRALGAVERRHRDGTGRTPIEHLFQARDERSAAERDALEAQAAWLASCAAIALR